MVTLDGDVLRQYPRVSRYNSPYRAHDAGCAVDLYPGGERAPSPVAGTVVETRTVRCPQKPHAEAHDHLVVVDTGDHLARMLHVDPAVEVGDELAVGDGVGRLVRSGFFAPWVDNHVHLGFRERDQNAVRASGSLPLDLDVRVEAAAWDGVGRVVETGETWVRLDAPDHPASGEAFAGLAADDGAVLDGGVPHYDCGGATGDADPVCLFGTAVGDRRDERTVAWRDVTPTADGTPVTGLSLWLGVDALGVKLVCPGHDYAVGDRLKVGVRA
jgi:hypothetical protein